MQHRETKKIVCKLPDVISFSPRQINYLFAMIFEKTATNTYLQRWSRRASHGELRNGFM